MEDKKGKPERVRKGEQMYDFYFSSYFAYYICKVKERKIKTRKKFLFFKLFSILIVQEKKWNKRPGI